MDSSLPEPVNFCLGTTVDGVSVRPLWCDNRVYTAGRSFRLQLDDARLPTLVLQDLGARFFSRHYVVHLLFAIMHECVRTAVCRRL